MQEIEAKILEVNKKVLEEKLKKISAKKVFDDTIETLFYDFKDGSIIKAKNVMRLRKEGKKVVLTFKNVKATAVAKIAEEYSTEVSDFQATTRILEFLGLKVIDSMQKHRISYEKADAHFDIDHYLGKYSFIPDLMEIEAKSVESIHSYAKALGYNAKDCIPWSTAQVIEHYFSSKKS